MEEQDDNPALLKVAEAVSDGTPVDWESAQSLHDESEAELAHLQALEVVAAAHRSARLQEPPLTFTDTAPSGRRGVKTIRVWVILGLALVALYLILQLLWRS